MRYFSVCSGIEAATCAWHPLGWEAAAFSEIEKFPRMVLQHHYPHVPLHGDFTTIKGDEYGAVELLVGGTPCQSFSVAGLRKGLADPRGNLMLEYGALAKRLGARWLVWENVPGVLSANGGRDFGTFLGMLGELGYGFAYRVLDAQYFGVAQRRRRVFVVGCLGDWRSAAAVLFERHGMQGHPPPRREAGKATPRSVAFGVAERSEVGHCLRSGASKADKHESTTYIAESVAGTLGARTGVSIGAQDAMNGHMLPVAPTLDAHFGNKMGLENQHLDGGGGCSFPAIAMCPNAGAMGRQDAETETLIPTIGGGFDVAHTLRGEGFDASEDGTGRGTPLVPVAFVQNSRDEVRLMGGDGNIVGALAAETGAKQQCYLQVRRLTPTECERLQGFPDGHTDIRPNGKATPDGPRYKALGNSMAVPVMRWIGERIQAVEAIHNSIAEAA